ncbi:MAG: hypothetical protein AAF541_00435 [Pseudomonadota bacterium]
MQHILEESFSALRQDSPGFDPQLDDFFEADEVLQYHVDTPEGQHADAPGVLIYISPKPGARLPDAWAEVLNMHNLVWIGAHGSGNEVHVARRVGLAQLGLAVAHRFTPTCDEKVYLTGFSGGGRVASMMLPAYPQAYAGAIFICGANPMFTATPETIEALKNTPMVFLTGTGDFNLEDTQMAIATYQQAGLTAAQLQIVNGLGHALPESADLDTALRHLAKI